jgi:hypothetical protein
MMARSSAVLKEEDDIFGDEFTELNTMSMSELMGQLSENFKLQQPIKQRLDPLDKRATAIKKRLLPMLMKEGLKKTTTKTETVSITEVEEVVIDDMKKCLAALNKDGYSHCITLKSKYAKEYADMKGKEIPGTHREVATRFIRVSAIK